MSKIDSDTTWAKSRGRAGTRRGSQLCQVRTELAPTPLSVRKLSLSPLSRGRPQARCSDPWLVASWEQWAPTRATFEKRATTSPSLRNYTDDLVALVASLDTPPLVVAHPWAACRPTAFDAIHRGQDRGDRCCRRSGYQGR